MHPVSRPALTLALCLAAATSLAEAPRRIVSLAPSLTAMVVELGGANRLAAVTPFCEATAAVPRVAGGIHPEPETVLGWSPDLVLATSMTPASTREQLSRLGLRVEVIDAGSLEAIRQARARLALLLARPSPTCRAATNGPSGKSVALLFGADTGYSAGGGTHAHEILEAAGLRNIAADAPGPWPLLGEEFLLAEDPDVIVVADYGQADREFVLRTLRAHPLRRHLAAVRAGRVVTFPAPVFSVPGPAALEAGEKLRSEVEKL